MQCKDIPDEPVLRFLALLPTERHNWYFGNEKDVHQALPKGIPDKLILEKMKMLIRRGLVDGCGCGCRGDFKITAKGLDYLTKVAKMQLKQGESNAQVYVLPNRTQQQK